MDVKTTELLQKLYRRAREAKSPSRSSLLKCRLELAEIEPTEVRTRKEDLHVKTQASLERDAMSLNTNLFWILSEKAPILASLMVEVRSPLTLAKPRHFPGYPPQLRTGRDTR